MLSGYIKSILSLHPICKNEPQLNFTFPRCTSNCQVVHSTKNEQQSKSTSMQVSSSGKTFFSPKNTFETWLCHQIYLVFHLPIFGIMNLRVSKILKEIWIYIIKFLSLTCFMHCFWRHQKKIFFLKFSGGRVGVVEMKW